ncbi:Protein kinase [Mycena sanguinolenta]|uniref:Protein kinase n=1 Tax=Mycena sanguinolenta TaxID=230812 RepID=A0A8H7CLQ6_9AGAR|nr:Protein kinase [Mycena sanguinolenta]
MVEPLHQTLYPITELVAAAELGHAFRDIFECYRDLYEKAGVVHGDISVNNLMYRKINGKISGVLADLDGMDKRPCPTRGTHLPYMALELLAPPPPPHFYRHDLESLFYVILIVSCHYHEGKKTEDRPLETWQHLAPEELYDQKSSFFLHGPVPTPTPNFDKLKLLNEDLHTMFANGFIAQANDKKSEGSAQL